MEEKKSSPTQCTFTVTWGTLLKIGSACMIGYLVVRLWRFEELLLLSLIIAIAFRPMLQWFEKRHLPRWTGVLAAGLILFGLTAVLIGILIPTVGNQGVRFVQDLPRLRDELLQRTPESGPIRRLAEHALSGPAFTNPEPIVKRLVAWGGAALARVTEFFVVLILAIYFVADGGRVYRWLLAFLPDRQCEKVAVAADEVTFVVGRYVVGQLFTSALAAVYTLVVLRCLHVPDAGLLAVLAGIFDLLPLIGFFLFIIPATLLALTVSPTAALLVVLLYTLYHLLENYFIVPKVYGNRLRLSTLTVLVACLAAGLAAGVVGVLIVLPLVACYPVVERMWLQPYLRRGTVQEHDRIDAQSS